MCTQSPRDRKYGPGNGMVLFLLLPLFPCRLALLALKDGVIFSAAVHGEAFFAALGYANCKCLADSSRNIFVANTFKTLSIFHAEADAIPLLRTHQTQNYSFKERMSLWNSLQNRQATKGQYRYSKLMGALKSASLSDMLPNFYRRVNLNPTSNFCSSQKHNFLESQIIS